MALLKKPKHVAPINGLEEAERRISAALDAAQAHPELVDGQVERLGNPRPLAPRIPEAAEMVDTMITNAAANAERWKANTLRPKKDPLIEAKKAATKWKNKVTEAIAGDRFAKGLAAVDETAMLATIEATPPSAFSDGIARRRAKIAGKFEKMRPMVIALANQLDAMPVDTDAQREAKMIAASRGMKDVGKRLKG